MSYCLRCGEAFDVTNFDLGVCDNCIQMESDSHE